MPLPSRQESGRYSLGNLMSPLETPTLEIPYKQPNEVTLQ